MTSSRERILHLLKTKGPQTASQLAKRLKVTSTAVRQHLASLDDLVVYEDERHGVGPNRMGWGLS